MSSISLGLAHPPGPRRAWRRSPDPPRRRACSTLNSKPVAPPSPAEAGRGEQRSNSCACVRAAHPAQHVEAGRANIRSWSRGRSGPGRPPPPAAAAPGGGGRAPARQDAAASRRSSCGDARRKVDLRLGGRTTKKSPTTKRQREATPRGRMAAVSATRSSTPARRRMHGRWRTCRCRRPRRRNPRPRATARAPRCRR